MNHPSATLAPASLKAILGLALLAGGLAATPQRTRRAPRLPDLEIPIPGGQGNHAFIGDLDADGDLEIVASAYNTIWAWHHDGTLLPGFPFFGYAGLLALADLDGDPLGDLELIYAESYVSGARIMAFHHQDADGWGGVDRVAGWPAVVTAPVQIYASSFPSVEDLDHDGSADVVFSVELFEWLSEDARIYRFDRDGALAPGSWPVHVEDHTFRYTSAACGDLDGDGNLEVVTRAVFAPFSGGMDHIHAWDATGTASSGFPAIHTSSPSFGSASPVLGDLTGDGLVDVVTGIGGDVVAIDSQGTELFRHALSSGGATTPALADLDEDGDLEIVVGVQHPDRTRVLVLDHAGNLLAQSVEVSGRMDSTFSPLVGDLDGDGLQELILATSMDHQGRPSRIHVFERDGTRRLDLTMLVPANPDNPGVSRCARIGDLDGDGEVELVVAGAGSVYVWSFDGAPSDCDWPMFQHDPHMSGRFQ